MRVLSVAVGLIMMSMSGCYTLSQPAKNIEIGRTNITVSHKLSLATKNALVSSGQNEYECLLDIQTCINAVDKVFFENDKPKLATLAELYLAHALSLKEQPSCNSQLQRPPIDPYYPRASKTPELAEQERQEQEACQIAYLSSLHQALRYSYAYVFYDQLTGQDTVSNIISEEQIKAQDIYQLAVSHTIDEIYQRKHGDLSAQNHYSVHYQRLKDSQIAQVPIRHIDFKNTNGQHENVYLYIANDPYYLGNLEHGKMHVFETLTSTYDASLPNLNVVNMRSGIGVNYVGSLSNRYTTQTQEAQDWHSQQEMPSAERIHPMEHLLLTVTVIPGGKTLDEVLNGRDFHVHLYNPYHAKTVEVLGKEYPLSANFSLGYAKWLSENQFTKLALTSMLEQSKTRLPELFMLEPYNPNKKVLIMLHGLASSPQTWVQLTNSLLADPILQDNYQVWQVFYSTNLPMLENRYQIQHLINDTFKQTDPTGANPASHHAVIISHSMGAVIARLMLSEDNLYEELSKLEKSAQDALAVTSKENRQYFADYQEAIHQRFSLSPLTQVDTAVFISAPFRGTDYADRWFTRTLRRIIRLPVSLTQTIIQPFGDGVQGSVFGSLYLQNGASQLSDKSVFMALTKNVTISPNVQYHSIMANNIKGKIDDANSAAGQYISDGIVPYESSHLQGAASETILTGGHSIHENPQTILYLRKILHEHLAALSSNHNLANNEPKP